VSFRKHRHSGRFVLNGHIISEASL
jgi:hypothetical protein